MLRALRHFAMASKRIPHLLGRLLGIDPNERYAHQPQDLHAQARHILEQHDVYLEVEPSVSDILEGCVPSRNGALGYLRSLFPSASWMRRYNGHWLLGDVMAGRLSPELLAGMCATTG